MSNPRSKLLAAAIVFLFVAGACRPVRPVVGPNGWLWDTSQVTVIDVTTSEQPAVSAPADDVTANDSGTVHDTAKADYLVANPPFATELAKDETGRTVTILKGFDLGEYGGNDSKCTRTGDPETIHIGEVVSSQDEKCLLVVEWSLKVGEKTVVAGVYAVHPGETFYVPLAVAGQNDSPRIVGTIHYLARGWNSHMYAADIAGARDMRDGTISYVGLSPTDPWVVAIADALK